MMPGEVLGMDTGYKGLRRLQMRQHATHAFCLSYFFLRPNPSPPPKARNTFKTLMHKPFVRKNSPETRRG